MARPQSTWLTFQVLFAAVVTLAVCALAISKIGKGESVGTWSAVLVGLPVLLAIGAWLTWRGSRSR